MQQTSEVIAGLDLGFAMIRLIVVRQGPLGPVLLATEEAPRPEGTAATQRELRALVRRVELRAGVPIRDVILGVRGSGLLRVGRVSPDQSSEAIAEPPAPSLMCWHDRLRGWWARRRHVAPASTSPLQAERDTAGAGASGDDDLPSWERLIAELPSGEALLQELPGGEDRWGRRRLAGTVDRATLAHKLRVVEGAGLRVREAVLDTYAALLGVTDGTLADRRLVLGVFGALRTACVVAQNGAIVCIDDRIAGAHAATTALASKLGISVVDAERLKRSIDLDEAPGDRSLVADILAQDLVDRLEMLHHVAAKAGTDDQSAVVLTGGGTPAAGLRRCATEIFERPVAIDVPIVFPGRAGAVRGADGWTTAVGLVHFALRRHAGLEPAPTPMASLRLPAARSAADGALRDGDGEMVATIVPGVDGFGVDVLGHARRTFPPGPRGILLAARYVEHLSVAPRRVKRLRPADVGALFDGRRVDVRNGLSPWPLAIFASLRAAALQRCPRLLAVEDAVRRHGAAPVVYASKTYDDAHVLDDITRFEAAAWFAVLAPTCDALRGWRRAFSATGRDMRARNVSLERFASRPDALWSLRHVPLVCPVESDLHLDLLLAATRAGVAPVWLAATQLATERAILDALGAIEADTPTSSPESAVARLAHALARVGIGDLERRTVGSDAGNLLRAAVFGSRLLRGAPVVRTFPSPPWSPPSAAGVRLLTTDLELVEEGQRMHHCIANHVPRALRGASFVFHVEHELDRATAELDAEGNLVAVFGFANEVDTPACLHARDVFEGWRRPHLLAQLAAARSAYVESFRPHGRASVDARRTVARALLVAVRGGACGTGSDALRALREAHARLAVLIDLDDDGSEELTVGSNDERASARATEELFVEVCDALAAAGGDADEWRQYRAAAANALRRIVRLAGNAPEARLILGQRLVDDARGKARFESKADLWEAASHLESATRALPGQMHALWSLSCAHRQLAQRNAATDPTRVAFHATAQFMTLRRMASQSEQPVWALEQAAACGEKWLARLGSTTVQETAWLSRLIDVTEKLVQATANDPLGAAHARARQRLTDVRVRQAERKLLLESHTEGEAG